MAHGATITDVLVESSASSQPPNNLKIPDCSQPEPGKPPADYCYINLHSVSSFSRIGIASSAAAPGVLIANGRQGVTITGYSEDYSLDDGFISRDGGYSWQKIHQGPCFYDIGDQGGVLLKAPQDTDTTEIAFSWDLGYHWKTISLPFLNASTLMVRSVKADPGKLGLKFVVHGLLHGALGYNHKSFVLTVDFSRLFSTPCLVTDDADYEEWIPELPSNACTLGRRLSYIRRKPYVLCSNPDDLEMSRVKNYCFCTELDWECDAGYFRDPKSGNCVLAGNLDESAKAPHHQIPEDCKDYYVVETGYRKVADSACERGLDLTGQIFPCPAHRNIK